MNAGQLKTILNEYPMSRPLKVIVDGHLMIETTVAEMLCKLIGQPQGGLLTFLGRSSAIIRERIGSEPGNRHRPPIEWLEIDLR